MSDVDAVEAPYDAEDLVAFVQEGDFLPVKNAIVSGAFSARSTDADGCSLLHWAAINNRIQIAKFLIKNGAESLPGGILGETPLHWALRKKYYAMAHVLHEHLHLDLSLRSKQGLDALNLVIRLGDLNAAFMLLTWGANPNAEDANGIAPLLWLMQNNNTSRGFEMSKLLIQFGANVTCVEPRTKNSLLHFLATNKKFDLIQAFYLYQNNPSFFRTVCNAAGQDVYKMATVSENRKMAKFLMDVMFFYLLPTWTPTVLVAALWLFFYFMLAWHGLLYGSVLTLLTAAVALYGLGQHYLIVHRDRFFVGSYAGFALLIGGCFFAYVSDIVSTPTKLVAVTLGLAVGYSAWQVHHTRPQLAPKEMQVELTQKILDAAPSEGTDEENQELVDFSQRQQRQQLQPPGGGGGGGGESVRLAVVKDAFTGRVSVVKQRLVSADDSSFRSSAYQTSSSSSTHGGSGGGGASGSSGGRTVEAVVRLRSLGPRLCGHCLSDKRCVEILKGASRSQRGGGGGLGHSSHSHSGHDADALDGSDSGGGGSGGGGPRTAISIATHCNYCQSCALDQDHHCPYLHTCVGRGNRRLFVLFQSLLCAACLVYFVCARYVAYDTLCDPLLMANARPADVAWYSPATLWRVERCVWSQYAHYAMVQYLSLGLSLYGGMVAYVQCVLVMKETTLQHLVKDRAPLLDAQRRAHMVDNFWRFVRTGHYTVVYPRSAAGAAGAAATAATAASASASSEMTHRQANTTGGVRSMLSALSATSKAAASGAAGPATSGATGSTSAAATAATTAAGSAVGRLWQRLEQSHGDDAGRRGGLDDDEDTDETPLLYFAAHEQSPGHRQRNGSFTTVEPPPTTTAAGRRMPPKKQVSFASHNQYQSPPSTSPDVALLARKGPAAAVVTHMPPKPATGSALDLTDVDLEAPAPLSHRRATDTRDGGSGGSGSDEEDGEEDSDGEAGFEEDEDDDYDDEFVDSDLNGYLGSGRSLADEAELARLLDEQRAAAARHQQHHDHSHGHSHSHGHGHSQSGGSLRGDVESGRSSRSGSERVAGGVEAVARQAPWQR